jgi:glycosyltransferase involved in cell wall biosynthesis
MKKKILVRGPVLSQSGYGEHARFVLRSLRTREDELDIHILPTGWGETGWIADVSEERVWLDENITKCAKFLETKQPYDVSVQVTIPSEWERIAPINIGVTAGIETNRVSADWLQKSNAMDKVIVVSEHAKQGFVETNYSGVDQNTGQQVTLAMQTPVEVAHYPVKTYSEQPDLGLQLEYDFNYLAVAQWGPRKNIKNLIRWFVEENYDQEVGLVLKTSIKNNSNVDREYAEIMIKDAISDIKEVDDRKCRVYLLHGDLSDEEMHSLYVHPKIKAMVSLTHGEGFGLPLFEAAYSGMPVIAPEWSGHLDFLYAPPENMSKSAKKKKTKKPYFAVVDYSLAPIPQEAVWPGVLEQNSMWCYPEEGSFKLRMRQVRKDYDKWSKRAKYLQKWILDEFDSDKKHQELSEMITPPVSTEMKEWLEQLSDIEIL